MFFSQIYNFKLYNLIPRIKKNHLITLTLSKDYINLQFCRIHWIRKYQLRKFQSQYQLELNIFKKFHNNMN